MVERIALRRGFGSLLAEGVKIASENIGKGSCEFAMHVKGEEIPMHDPRYNRAWDSTMECLRQDQTIALVSTMISQT